MKLGFICYWDKIKEKTWSGTSYGLYKELNNYFDLYDVDIGCNVKDIYTAIYIFRKIIDRILNKGDMGVFLIKIMRHRANKLLKAKDIPIFQFSELLENYNGKQYIYQDLYAGYIKKIYDEDREIFNVSGFQRYSAHAIYTREKLQHPFLMRADGIFTMGHWIANEMVRSYGLNIKKVHVVGGGINLDYKKIDYSKKNGKRILFVGRDFERKNGPLVVDAFKILKEEIKDAELYIAGPEKLKIQYKGIYCLGDVESKELYNYFNLCDIFCMPSKFEPYGLVFIEALTYGLPCIGKNAYEMPYFIDDGITGYLLNENSPEQLAQLMGNALKNQTMKNIVRSRRDWYIEEYSWKTVAKRIADVIKNDQ